MYSVAVLSASAVRATIPATIRPIAPSTASTPPVGSSSSASSRRTAIAAIRTNASMLRLSAFAFVGKRAALDVGPQFALVRVRALLEVDELPLTVVEGGVRIAEAGAEALFYVLAGVRVAGVGDGRLREEGACGVFGVLTVDAEKGDSFAVLRR